MENSKNIISSFWQILIYAVVFGIILISVPKTGVSYIATRAMQALEVLFFLVLFIPCIQQKIQIKRYSIYINLWWMILLCLTYIHPHNVGFTPFLWWLHVGMFLLFGRYFWQTDFQQHLKWMSILLGGLIYLNAILLVLYPEGLWVDEEWEGMGSPIRYLFGNYNQIGCVCLLGIATHSIYTFHTQKGYVSLFTLIAVSLFSVIFIGSMTSSVGILIVTIYILFHRMIKRPLLWLTTFCIAYITIFILFVWLGNSIEDFSFATNFIENTLNKDTTFSRRTTLWSNAVDEIVHSPIIGYGIKGSEWFVEHLGGSGPHNLWLMLMLQGGCILCFTFIGIVIYTIKSAMKAKTYSATVSVVILAVLFVMSFFETYDIVLIFLMLQIIFYTTSLDNKPKEDQQIRIS